MTVAVAAPSQNPAIFQSDVVPATTRDSSNPASSSSRNIALACGVAPLSQNRASICKSGGVPFTTRNGSNAGESYSSDSYIRTSAYTWNPPAN